MKSHFRGFSGFYSQCGSEMNDRTHQINTSSMMRKQLYTILAFLALSMTVSIQAQPSRNVNGDVNGDDVVNISDINAVIDIILGGTPSQETIKRGDVNGDGVVNITDINAVIDIILGGGSGGTGDSGVANPQNVFTNGMPKTVYGKTITTNDAGQVVTIQDDDVTITFEYLNQLHSLKAPRSSSQSVDVVMTVREGDYGEYMEYRMSLNSAGFATYVEGYYFDGTYYWLDESLIFEYDDMGHLTKMIQCYEYPDVTTINWQDGDIVSVHMTDGESDTEDWDATLFYTGSNVAQPIENKGCVMFYDEMFAVDIDDLKYAYYAGLLGKATQHLPMGMIQRYIVYGDSYSEQFEWTLNEDGFPTSAHVMSEYDDDWYTITW